MANASPNATYIPPARIGLTLGPWGLALGPWGFALGLPGFALGPQGFSDTNTLVSATQTACIGGRTQCEAPMQVVLRYSGIIICLRLSLCVKLFRTHLTSKVFFGLGSDYARQFVLGTTELLLKVSEKNFEWYPNIFHITLVSAHLW